VEKVLDTYWEEREEVRTQNALGEIFLWTKWARLKDVPPTLEALRQTIRLRQSDYLKDPKFVRFTKQDTKEGTLYTHFTPEGGLPHQFILREILVEYADCDDPSTSDIDIEGMLMWPES